MSERRTVVEHLATSVSRERGYRQRLVGVVRQSLAMQSAVTEAMQDALEDHADARDLLALARQDVDDMAARLSNAEREQEVMRQELLATRKERDEARRRLAELERQGDGGDVTLDATFMAGGYAPPANGVVTPPPVVAPVALADGDPDCPF